MKPIQELITFIRGNSLFKGRDAFLVNGSRVNARFIDMTLDSAFQPIVEAHSGLVHGHEALLRVRSGERVISPEAVFRIPADDEVAYLDRLCRTLHMLNFLIQNVDCSLYLNVHPRHLLMVYGGHGQVFENILRSCGLGPERITIEIVESSSIDSARLEAAVANYRERGYRIAIDDFGRESSNLDRLWRLHPDEVKFDRSLIAEAGRNPKLRRVLGRLVAIVHDLEADALCEGIETRAELAIAKDAGFDLLQGYLLCRPQPNCHVGELVTKPMRNNKPRHAGVLMAA